jgi:hypothetical protein
MLNIKQGESWSEESPTVTRLEGINRKFASLRTCDGIFRKIEGWRGEFFFPFIED